MQDNAKETRATIIPTMRYRDAPAAIDWLCGAFGFERHLVVPGEDGTIVHAQLVFGNGMIMLGSARDDAFGRLVRPPEGGVGTQSPYVVVADADLHYARAKEAGAEILFEIKDEDYGGRAIPAATRRATSGTSAPSIRGNDDGPECRSIAA